MSTCRSRAGSRATGRAGCRSRRPRSRTQATWERPPKSPPRPAPRRRHSRRHRRRRPRRPARRPAVPVVGRHQDAAVHVRRGPRPVALDREVRRAVRIDPEVRRAVLVRLGDDVPRPAAAVGARDHRPDPVLGPGDRWRAVPGTATTGARGPGRRRSSGPPARRAARSRPAACAGPRHARSRR